MLLCICYEEGAEANCGRWVQVRDAQGRKMSKSLGNVVDPVEVIGQYGTDALRFTLATGTLFDMAAISAKSRVNEKSGGMSSTSVPPVVLAETVPFEKSTVVEHAFQIGACII